MMSCNRSAVMEDHPERCKKTLECMSPVRYIAFSMANRFIVAHLPTSIVTNMVKWGIGPRSPATFTRLGPRQRIARYLPTRAMSCLFVHTIEPGSNS